MFASWRDFLKTKITLFYSHFSLFLALSTQQNDFVCSSGELHHENCDQEVSSILLTWIPSQVSIYIRCSAPEYPFSEFGGKILPHLRSFGPFWIFDIGKSFFGVGKTKIICFHTFWILSADCIRIQRKQKPDPIWNSERPSRPSLPISSSRRATSKDDLRKEKIATFYNGERFNSHSRKFSWNNSFCIFRHVYHKHSGEW